MTPEEKKAYETGKANAKNKVYLPMQYYFNEILLKFYEKGYEDMESLV